MEELLKKKRQVVIKGQSVTGKICPPGYDYCWECGFIAKVEEFLEYNHCPNPACPRPYNWND